jgi:hypothetical protein
MDRGARCERRGSRQPEEVAHVLATVSRRVERALVRREPDAVQRRFIESAPVLAAVAETSVPGRRRDRPVPVPSNYPHSRRTGRCRRVRDGHVWPGLLEPLNAEMSAHARGDGVTVVSATSGTSTFKSEMGRYTTP